MARDPPNSVWIGLLTRRISHLLEASAQSHGGGKDETEAREVALAMYYRRIFIPARQGRFQAMSETGIPKTPQSPSQSVTISSDQLREKTFVVSHIHARRNCSLLRLRDRGVSTTREAFAPRSRMSDCESERQDNALKPSWGSRPSLSMPFWWEPSSWTQPSSQIEERWTW